MSSNLVIRFTISAAGADVPFAQPFAIPSMLLESPPAQYDVVVPADDVATLWDGAPLPTTFDFFACTADQSCDIEFIVNSGTLTFTLPLLTGGWPIVIPGDRSFSGGVAGTEYVITSIRAKNRNTDTAANVSVIIAKADS